MPSFSVGTVRLGRFWANAHHLHLCLPTYPARGEASRGGGRRILRRHLHHHHRRSSRRRGRRRSRSRCCCRRHGRRHRHRRRRAPMTALILTRPHRRALALMTTLRSQVRASTPSCRARKASRATAIIALMTCSSTPERLVAGSPHCAPSRVESAPTMALAGRRLPHHRVLALMTTLRSQVRASTPSCRARKALRATAIIAPTTCSSTPERLVAGSPHCAPSHVERAPKTALAGRMLPHHRAHALMTTLGSQVRARMASYHAPLASRATAMFAPTRCSRIRERLLAGSS